MRLIKYSVILVLTWLAVMFNLGASSFLPMNTAQQVAASAGVFRGDILSLNVFKNASDGHIYTATAVRVDEVFKGQFPAIVKLVQRGGSLGNYGEINGGAPVFKVGEKRVLFVSQRNDGTLFVRRSDANADADVLPALRQMTANGVLAGNDFSNQSTAPSAVSNIATPKATPLAVPTSTATNLLADGSGISPRFTAPDRGEGIPYLIDADYLPAGISQSQAIAAVQSALGAWTAVTSLKYTYIGLQSFGQAAGNIGNGDGILRIQLHDHYNYIGNGDGGDILGQGGSYFETTIAGANSSWTLGGNVNGNDFYRSYNGYVVLNSTNVAMQNILTFAQVLCHEIGHSIGLAHSSENPNESNPLLKGAIMYFEISSPSRGAILGAYDPPVARQVNPLTNTPPYAYDRMMDIVTTQNNATISNVNFVQLRGYDLQTTNLVLQTEDATTGNGSFQITNNSVHYTPAGFFPDTPSRLDPAGTSYYDSLNARFSDGTNASPYVRVRVLSFAADSYSEGIPDSWRQTYFGDPNPSHGVKHHAGDDADGDLYSNLQEFHLGSNPTDKTSNLRVTFFNSTNIQWQAKPYEVYEIYGSTNLSTNATNWARVVNPIVPTNTIGTATGFTNGGPRQFFRVEKVP